MKKKASLIALCALSLTAAFALAGCGVSLDREIAVQDMSACVENMLVEAVEQGLGGVWLGMYPRQDRVSAIREAFELPENLIPFAAVPVGHPAGEQKAKDRFDPKRIRWEK